MDRFSNPLNNHQHRRRPPCENKPHLAIGGHQSLNETIGCGRLLSGREAQSPEHHRTLLRIDHYCSGRAELCNTHRQISLAARPATHRRKEDAVGSHAEHQIRKGDNPHGAINDRRVTVRAQDLNTRTTMRNHSHPT